MNSASPGRSPVVRAEDLSKIYGKGAGAVHAVRDACLEIKEGERVYIHGPSGAGKSTLLHLLGGLDRPTGGRVIYAGEDLFRISDRKRSRVRNRAFGFVFQFYHLLPELTVERNIMLPALIGGTAPGRAARKKARELMETVGIGHRAGHRAGRLSGGEAQRTAIARALINSPSVLFCDEPTGNLDSGRSREIYGLIREISERDNMSVVLVTHEGPEVDFFHSEYHMKDGAVEKAGAAAGV